MSKKEETISRPRAMAYGGGEERNLAKHLSNGAKDHGMGVIHYAFHRLKNYICCILAWGMPSNKIRVALNRWKGVHIADDSYIGMFCFIDNTYPEYIYIEKHVSISKGASIVAHNNPMPHFNKTMIAQVAPIILREGSLVALDCILNPGVEVGEYAIVSAGSVVYGKVEPMTIVRGNPATKIRDVKLTDELTEYVQQKVAARLEQEAAEKAARKAAKQQRAKKEEA